MTVPTFIREQLDFLDDQQELEKDCPKDMEPFSEHFYLGSKQKSISFSNIEAGDRLFYRFRIRLGDFMTKFLASESSTVIRFKADDRVCLPLNSDKY